MGALLHTRFLDQRRGRIGHDPKIVHKVIFIGIVDIETDPFFYRHILFSSFFDLPKTGDAGRCKKSFGALVGSKGGSLIQREGPVSYQ